MKESTKVFILGLVLLATLPAFTGNDPLSFLLFIVILSMGLGCSAGGIYVHNEEKKL